MPYNAMPLLTPAESAEQAVVFRTTRPSEMGCIAGETNGTFWIWNQKGDGTAMPPSSVEPTVALLLQGRFSALHFEALHRALLVASGEDALRISEVMQHVARTMSPLDYATISHRCVVPVVPTDC